MAVDLRITLALAGGGVTISDQLLFAKNGAQQALNIKSAALNWIAQHSLYSTFSLTGRIEVLITGEKSLAGTRIPNVDCPLACIIEWC